MATIKKHPVIEFDTPVIETVNLQKSFGHRVVLKDIDLKVFKGENLVVLGRSGSGKSVLIKLLCGLLLPDSGDIRIFGQNTDQLTPHGWEALRKRIGFSFQNSALYDSMTVRKNLEFPLIRNRKDLTIEAVDEAIRTVLEEVGLLSALHQMPSELSGGQRKRIGIARTLILNPEIMLYDEPTAGLDPITSMEINHLINEVQARFGTSSIIITHDLTCAKTVGDRMGVLIDGQFERQGTFEEVFRSGDDQVKPFYDYNFVDEP